MGMGFQQRARSWHQHYCRLRMQLQLLFGQKKFDLWEISKDCGCNCGCCNYNKLKVKTTPQFWINKEGAEKAGRYIVGKNKGLAGEALDEYMNMNFGTIWDEYDVLKKDMVEVEQMSSFFKKLLKDFTAQI